MNTPVAFLIYKRPDLTVQVFERIRQARPVRLLLIADGPRPGEEEKCRAARDVVEQVDWPCEVSREYSQRNMGCRKRVSSGLDWVFSLVEEAIILEDDCLPEPTFFRFCQELLVEYRDDLKVGHVAGTDYAGAVRDIGASYYFSRYTSIWGWATWRRAWQDYDADMKAWPAVKSSRHHFGMFASRAQARHFEWVWDDIYSGETDTWDGQWLFCSLLRGSLAVCPNGNLVSNLGCREDARHTVDSGHPFAALPTHPMQFPICHPSGTVPDDALDRQRAEAEFLRKHDLLWRTQCRLRNKHFYGSMLRRLPFIGRYWTRWRDT